MVHQAARGRASTEGESTTSKARLGFMTQGSAPNLWRRWLGYKVDNDGGEQEELAGEGRMCLPGMLLHPVKGVNLVIEGGKTVEQEEDEKAEASADAGSI